MATTDNEPDVIPLDIPKGWRLLNLRTELTEPGDRWLLSDGWVLYETGWSWQNAGCPPVIRRIDERVEKVKEWADLDEWDLSRHEDNVMFDALLSAIELLREKGVL